MARFPYLALLEVEGELAVSEHGLDGNHNHGLPHRIADNRWHFEGGANDVIHVAADRDICKLKRYYPDLRGSTAPPNPKNAVDLTLLVAAEGLAATRVRLVVGGAQMESLIKARGDSLIETSVISD